MIPPKTEIQAVLVQLVGQPLRYMWRPACQSFEFGSAHPATNRKGEAVTVHEFILHVSCDWRVERDGSILLSEEHLRRDGDFLDEVNKGRLLVESVEAADDGSFHLNLSDGAAICVCNDQREGEAWRLFYFDESRPHFVVENGP